MNGDDDNDDDNDDGDGDGHGDGEPRVLWVRSAIDAHSGAFGVDVTFLLLGGASTIALTLLLSAILRRKANDEDAR